MRPESLHLLLSSKLKVINHIYLNYLVLTYVNERGLCGMLLQTLDKVLHLSTIHSRAP